MMFKQVTGRPLSVYIAALALALIVPALVFSVVVSRQWVLSEQSRLDSVARGATDDVLARVDQYLAGQIAMLQALATSPALDAGDFARFDQQARELLSLQGVNIVMRDRTGQHIINTRRPWGSPLPRVSLDPDRVVVETRRPHVTDTLIGTVTRQPLILVNVPVLRGGEVVYVLNASIPLEILSQLVRDNEIAEPYVASIVDRKGQVIARSAQPEAFLGKLYPLFPAVNGARGSLSGSNFEGAPVVASFRKSALSGWTVFVAVEKTVLEGPLRRSQWLLAGLAALLAILAVAASLWLVRKVLSSHRALDRAARDLAYGKPFAAPQTPIRDVNVVGVALRSASSQLTEQASALAAANRELEARVEARTHELAEKTALLTKTLENMDQGLIVIDPQRRLPVVSRRAMELLDLPPEMMSSQPSYDAVVGFQIGRGEFADADEVLDAFVNSGALEPHLHVFERTRPNGTVLEIRTVPLPDGSAVRTYTNITERRRAEAALRDSEVRYREVLDTAHDAFVSMDSSGTITAWNAAAERMFGRSAADAIGCSLAETVVPERLREAHRKGLERYLETGTGPVIGKPVELVSLRHDGREFPIEMTISTIELDGAVSFNAFIRDITERKARDQAIAESQARYRLLAENASDLIVLVNGDGRRSYVSPSVKPMLGYDVEEAHRFKPGELVHPDDRSRVAATMRGLNAEQPHASVLYRLRRKDGAFTWVEGALQRVEEAGEVTTVMAIRDVTERQRQAGELEHAKEAAEQASQAKTDFLAAMSHEIRTPLNSIVGFTNLLLDDKEHTGEDRRKLRLIQDSSTALLTIVNDILDFSKIEAGQVELEPQTFSLRGLLDNTVSIVRGFASRQELEIKLVVDPDLADTLVGDPDRLRQVLLNFLNNGVKFTAAGSVTLAATRERTGVEGERLRLSVADTGIGVPKDKVGRLFQRFSQVDSSIAREFGGTGLGLAISKSLVELMGGTVGVNSVEGQGSTFWFSVTLARGESLQELASPDNALARTAARPARILLVEDLHINQELAKAVLERAGHTVEVASDGAEAVQAVQRSTFDVVLMDVQMPVMDGVSATERIRSLSGTFLNLPIIAMTANVLPEQVARFKRAGMNDHVGKPFKRNELLITIDRAMRPPEAKHAAGPDDGGGTQDREAYDHLVRLLGPDKVLRLLTKLEVQLADGSESAPTPSEGADSLARDARALVSSARLLGFFQLARLAREVEEDRFSGGPMQESFARMESERVRVLHEIKGLGPELERRAQSGEASGPPSRERGEDRAERRAG